MTILKTSNLSKSFAGKPAVIDASVIIEPGKIYGLLGPNGSGKSTFMKMVAGLFYPTRGAIDIMGTPVSTETKAHVAYMSTEPYFYNYMSIKQVGQFHQDFYEDFDSEKFTRLIADMNLEMSMKVDALSSGMAAKLKIASTMSRKAKLYMLDEPLNGIDLVARDKIMSAILDNATADNAIIISS
nr:ABC transporter ATP-binding protein [Vallitaleaceae bacterium]